MITLFMLAMVCRGGGMADAQVSGTCGGNTMWVQLPSSAPKDEIGEIVYKGLKRQTDSICRLLMASCRTVKENHK